LQRFHNPLVLPGPVILNDAGLSFQEGFLVHSRRACREDCPP
jgi:hypothetical protein